MYNNIPKELRDLDQWVCWKPYISAEGKKTKLPVQANGDPANSTDRATWCSFEQAVQASKKFAGIGFVLNKDDPFCIIDLDNKPDNPCTPEQLARHQKIYESFDSYTEYSTSGTGIHIIMRGSLPTGVKRDNVEAYSDARFMICTGNVLRDGPVRDYQQLLTMLYGEMQPVAKVELHETEEVSEDAAIVDMAMSATNADKFNELCIGDWPAMGYGSQSEADFALLSILAFYTQSNEQVRRIFRMSNLGKREKAVKNNTYLNFALGKIRAQQPAPVDISQLQINAIKLIGNIDTETGEIYDYSNPSEQSQTSTNVQMDQTGMQGSSTMGEEVSAVGQNSSTFPIDLPPGLIGELAQYFYSTSIRPVPEISLIAAIGAVAGVVGRSYNISAQGLAQYLILLARTGTGKEAISSGISRLFHEVQMQVPMATQFSGPAVFASGPALHRVLSEKPCFVSVLGEFGFTVQRLSNPRANSAEITLKQLILDSFGKSGYGQVLQPSVYSDKEKNINPVASPNMTIIGESTPESFYDGLDQSHIASGFLSRFLILEYTGDRPYFNEHTNQPLPQWLKQKFCDLVTVAITTSNNNQFCQVGMTPEAKAILDEFNLYVDSKIRGANDVVREIWNRAHLKALKLAGLIAVGCNPHRPVVDVPMATWAKKLVEHDASSLQKRFNTGDIGMGDSKQINDLRRVVESYMKLNLADAKKFGATEQMHSCKIIPYQFIIKKSYNLASFKNDRMGSTLSLKRTLQTLVDSGNLKLIDIPTLEKKFSYAGVAYGIGKHW